MYDVKARRWKQDCENEDLLRWSREPANAGLPEAMFLRADVLLEKNRRGGDVAEAVALMESAAKQDHPQAMLAMGQMFYWGWAVHRDRKTALEWYRKAAALDYEPARKALEEIKRRRILNVVSIIAAVALLAALTAGGIFLARDLSGKRVIRVNPNTDLAETPTLEEFMNEISGLIENYDDELVISGQVSTNRLILQLDGKELDLREFLADKVIAREDNLIVIQFASEEEAQRCLEALKQRQGIRFVEVDEYTTISEAVREEDSTLPVVTSAIPDGTTFNSWGIVDMGVDRLRDYVSANYPDNVVEIVVIDSGIADYVKKFPQVVECLNAVTGEKTVVPGDHGTHVTGTVLEGVNGTSARIHCVDVFNGEEAASALIIALAVDACIQSDMDVINMSIGGAVHSDVKTQMIQAAVDAGVVVVNAAGNESINVNGAEHCCPAEMEDIIVVGAYDVQHNPADFSNFGTTVDVCAPGVDIFSFDYGKEGGLVAFSGTSMAAPHITALAALVKLIYPDATPAQVEMYIKDYCRTYRNPSMYATGNYGVGAPDATKFIETDADRS